MPTRTKNVSSIPLMGLATSFWSFKTLASALELDLFSKLTRGKGASAQEVATALGIEARPAEMLLTGCASLDLLEKRKDRYRNTPMAEEFLVRGKPYFFGGFVEMLDRRLYAGWGKLTEALRTNRPTTWDPKVQKSLFDGLDPIMLEHFWEAMHSISTSTAAVLAKVVDFRRFRKLLDVGGGSGAFDIELCRQHRHLRATVYDLPQVVEIAAQKIAEAKLSARVGTSGGDFFRDAVYPSGHDVILLSMIMHDWSEEDDRAILKKCFRALPSGGAVLISELLVNDDKTGPPPGALMSLNMLIETSGGRNYTASEYSEWLADIGFHKIRRKALVAPGANGVVIGYKP
jgi:2-polyprenyl-3-methyl-5-hydroxy-6-metoxy-1,4-benzoquinol methylase